MVQAASADCGLVFHFAHRRSRCHWNLGQSCSRRHFFPLRLDKELLMTTLLSEQMRGDLDLLCQRMNGDMTLVGLVPGSRKAYVNGVRKLTAHYGLLPDRLTEQQVRDYFLYLKNDKQGASG